MTDESEDVDPEDPRPSGHYPRFRDNEWHYVPGELAQTISQLGYSTYHCSTDLETEDLISSTHIVEQNYPRGFLAQNLC
jgi:hypothetical protein